MKGKEPMIMVDVVEAEVQTTVCTLTKPTPFAVASLRALIFPSSGAGRKRRRSTSPWDRDRYEPRPRYDDYGTFTFHPHNVMPLTLSLSADPHRGGHSPRRSHHPSRPAPQDPHTLDYPASLKQYADWFRYFFPQQAAEEDSLDKQAEIDAGDGSKPRNGIRSKWEKYKKDFASNQVRVNFIVFFFFFCHFSLVTHPSSFLAVFVSTIQSFSFFTYHVIKTARFTLLKSWRLSFPIFSYSQRCSSIACSNITGSLPGSRRNTIQRRSSSSSVSV